MKCFFDTEFTGLSQDTTLISIGVITEDDRTFYAEFTDYNSKQINQWLKDNIIANLSFKEHKEHYKITGYKSNVINHQDSFSYYSIELNGNTADIKNELLQWLAQFDSVEFWSDCLAYDWVLLNNLIANYDEGYPVLPVNINYIPFDISTVMQIKGIDPDINREEFANIKDSTNKHNSLWDAKMIKKCYYKLME